jgi:hypothetical protein
MVPEPNACPCVRIRWLCRTAVTKYRSFALAALALAAAAVILLLGWEFHWRLEHRLAKPQAPSPTGAFVAEVRGLPPGPRLAAGATGVYLRSRHEYLRALRPRLVFAGHCDEVETRWFGERRLVIECELRAGEPQLLHDIVDGVVIELVVQRRFA